MACARFFISGRVQGVFFRASTRAEAEQLGVTGWVRNLTDGRVEVLARADEAVLDALAAWLQHGPANARVTDVQRLAVEPADEPQGASFVIR